MVKRGAPPLTLLFVKLRVHCLPLAVDWTACRLAVIERRRCMCEPGVVGSVTEQSADSARIVYGSKRAVSPCKGLMRSTL
jgi:hypothetical protein